MLVCVLPGFLEPTAGNALIGGYDIRRSLDKVRQSLVLCPQHDVLFDSLTVEEHLEFFGRVSHSVVTSHLCLLCRISTWSLGPWLSPQHSQNLKSFCGRPRTTPVLIIYIDNY